MRMKRSLALLLILVLTLSSFMVGAYADDTAFVGEKYSISSGYSLTVFWSEGDRPEDSLLIAIQKVFFDSYPAMREIYGTTEQKEVSVFLIDEADLPEGVSAYTAEDQIFCSRQFLEAERGNLNCIVHELFHVVQNGYPNETGDQMIGVLCEGLADVARAEYGVYDDPAWSLAAYEESQSYMDSYTVTAAFLTWIMEDWGLGESLCIRLNRLLHEGGYTDGFWSDMTGQDLDNLWMLYAADAMRAQSGQ